MLDCEEDMHPRSLRYTLHKTITPALDNHSWYTFEAVLNDKWTYVSQVKSFWNGGTSIVIKCAQKWSSDKWTDCYFACVSKDPWCFGQRIFKKKKQGNEGCGGFLRACCTERWLWSLTSGRNLQCRWGFHYCTCYNCFRILYIYIYKGREREREMTDMYRISW